MPQSQPSAQSSAFKQSRFRWTTDPTFYPTARLAMEAPRERLAYVAGLAPDNKSRSDALFVVDVDPASPSYGSVVSRLDLPNVGDELHHFGWNACSAALCPYAPHPHLERRYLVVPGLRSSRIHIIDTKADSQKLEIVKIIEPERNSRPYRLLSSAHSALWSRGHLRERSRRSEWGRPRRNLYSRSP